MALELLLARSRLRAEKKTLDRLFEERSWALVDGVLMGFWVECANGHAAFSETPQQDGWRQENFLGRPFWLCDVKCASEWRGLMTAKMGLYSEKVSVTWQDGKKSTLVTTGKTLEGETSSFTY